MCRRGECILYNVKAFHATLTHKTLKNPKIHNEEDEQQIKNLSYLTNDKIPARDRALSSPFTFF